MDWEHAMAIANDVYDLMNTYTKEREHNQFLHRAYVACNSTTWILGLAEIGRKVHNDNWWKNVRPCIIRRRNLLTHPHGFRTALETALQLKSMGKPASEIRRMLPEVYGALSGVMNPTDLQLDELMTYDRTGGQ